MCPWIDLITRLPKVEELCFNDCPDSTVFVGAAGFEDRSLSTLREAKLCGKQFSAALSIEYLPHDEQNRKEEYLQLLHEVGIQPDRQHWVTYNRFDPETFEESLHNQAIELLRGQHVLVDISGMSKMLITVLLESITRNDIHLLITYAEAKKYHPNRAIYEARKLNYTEGSPDFLTTDVFRNVTTKALSSVAMQGYPIAMVAFPTFNRKDLMSILNELNPQRLVLVEGKPHDSANDWRIGAIQEINRSINDYITPEIVQASTFFYEETLERLEETYKRYCKDHKIVVAPTGSKLQTLAVFVFRRIRPDVQIIYPVTRRFEEKYTEGHTTLWMISFGSTSKLITELSSHRFHALDELSRLIGEIERKSSQE